MTALIDLDDGRALDPAVVGAKAAGLARARRAGLPVLPGVVVPVGEERGAVGAGLAAMAARGSGGARLAVVQRGIGAALALELREAAARLGGRLVVRSTSPLEGEGVWSGAFASYAELSPDEAGRAVAGCWASVFSEDALGRAGATGRGPGEVPMAALVQREIQPRLGGVASVGPDGVVEVVWVEGSPAALVGGAGPGLRARVEADGRVRGAAAAGIDPGLLGAVAALARGALEAAGGNTIEWAVDDAGLWLLQVLSGGRRTARDGPVGPAVNADPRLDGLARLLLAHPGPLGEALVLPWALGGPPLPEPASGPQLPGGDDHPAGLLARVRALADSLTAARWGTSAAEGRARAGEVFRMLRGPDPLGAFELVEGLTPVDPRQAAEALGLLEALGRRLAGARRLPREAWLKHLGPADTEALAAGAVLPPERRLGRGRWEPFLVSALAAAGAPLQGEPVVAGSGAGRVRVVESEADAAAAEPREVLLAAQPLNYLAPLLWEAAAVVTLGGSPGAHLFEVAASLGVPAVCDLDRGGAFEDRASREGMPVMASVDGASGVVHLVWD